MALARRRADLARMKQKALRVYPHDQKVSWANHLAGCSCWMCGNPRRHSGAITVQERRAPEAREWEA